MNRKRGNEAMLGTSLAWIFALLLAWVPSWFLLSCATNPVTGEKELMLVSEAQEIEMGRQAAQQVPQELGLIDNRELASFVASQGNQIASSSERPNLPWEFHVVDSPVVNAFALPGGFIYLTRGILAHMNSEAEMVGILGHEIGHVTARHSAQQLSQMQLTNIGLGLGMVFVPEVRPYGDLLQTGLGLMFLKFGRDDEREADRLGVRYSIEAGYDPRRMAAFFDVLDRLREGSGQVIPSWLSTHPEPADREQRILELAREALPATQELAVREERFKERLNGMVFGDNPREGFMDGNVFKHPELRFQVEFPPDWNVENTRQAVYAGSREAAFQLSASQVSGGTDPRAHAAAFFRQYGLQSGGGNTTEVSGFAAFVTPFRANTQGGTLAGEAAFIRDGSTMYELFAYTSSARFRSTRDTLLRIIGSFSRLTDPRALGVQPQTIRLHRVPRTMSARQALLGAGVVEEQLEALALLNQVRLDDRVEAGTILKSVTQPSIPTTD